MELRPFKERAERVLDRTFCGLHHINTKRLKWLHPDGEFEMCEYSTSEELSTFDGEKLTLLVIAAHDELVRVSIVPSGSRMVKIQMWPRKGREGKRYERHPSIETAIVEARKY